jgi:hypothetical protein
VKSGLFAGLDGEGWLLESGFPDGDQGHPAFEFFVLDGAEVMPDKGGLGLLLRVAKQSDDPAEELGVLGGEVGDLDADSFGGLVDGKVQGFHLCGFGVSFGAKGLLDVLHPVFGGAALDHELLKEVDGVRALDVAGIVQAALVVVAKRTGQQ